ncbi:MAG: hypothetical protein P1U63_05695 [Coxiellaceae bacterium]|nr:hypothetical protein [Coxiellaceae bacterium]
MRRNSKKRKYAYTMHLGHKKEQRMKLALDNYSMIATTAQAVLITHAKELLATDTITYGKIESFIYTHLHDLVANALDSIVTRAKVDPHLVDAKLVFTSTCDEEGYAVTIHDNGTGFKEDFSISKEKSEKHADPTLVGGLGIGLFRMKKELAAEKGEITCKNHAKHGDHGGQVTATYRF